MMLITYFLYLIIIYKIIILLDVIFFNHVIKLTEFMNLLNSIKLMIQILCILHGLFDEALI